MKLQYKKKRLGGGVQEPYSRRERQYGHVEQLDQGRFTLLKQSVDDENAPLLAMNF